MMWIANFGAEKKGKATHHVYWAVKAATSKPQPQPLPGTSQDPEHDLGNLNDWAELLADNPVELEGSAAEEAPILARPNGLKFYHVDGEIGRVVVPEKHRDA